MHLDIFARLFLCTGAIGITANSLSDTRRLSEGLDLTNRYQMTAMTMPGMANE
jgi:hypothetical protein